jgi:signal transduction histidine kinase
VEGAREGVAKGLKLTSELLRLARQQGAETQLLNANDLLRSLKQFLKYAVGDEIRIVCDLESDIPACFISRPQFNAAILNLVINSRDAMPNGGEVRICTASCVRDEFDNDLARRSEYVRVRIEDNGLGMPAEVARRAVEPLFTTKGENGTGLGLPHVNAFMLQSGGGMNITSTLGVGTTVDLLFPRA